ncbi:preprotein translocase subunit SecG [Peptacetobacter hominis]|uniref:Protein-export membrane protein SecG n=1 Tax=Peptacetobacter hominis TaxID=2743610 RepID=A0A544QY01_9FIRM|nr:preprotein translocase subunit SecG [Peptacetobacter hominis]TQQ85551.1 preprotein translocase subunit SecG [Peptacetobacter hominis]
MVNILMATQVILGIALVIAIMPQENKTAMPSQYGGEGNQSYFKPKGKQAFLNKVTKIVAVLFFINAIALLMVSK